jgi:hypothetical protein
MVKLEKLISAVAAVRRLGMEAQPSIGILNTFSSRGSQLLNR